MHNVEAELIKVLKLKKKISDRQKYLHAILVAMDDRDTFTDDMYDALSDEAAEWHKEAVEAKDADRRIPDFAAGPRPPEDDEPEDDEAEDEDEPSEEDDDTAAYDDGVIEAEAEAEEAEGGTSADEEPDFGRADDDNDTAGDDAATYADSEEGVDEEVGEEAQVEDDEASRKLKKAAGKPVKADEIRRSKKKADPVKPLMTQVHTGTFGTPDYDAIDGTRDRFGIIKGTKTAEAVRMYSKGCTSRDIIAALGARYYNILRKLESEGHVVEKKPGGFWTLIHKDDIGKPKLKRVK